MTVRTPTQLKSQVATLFADNTSGDITPADLRSVFIDMVDTMDSMIEDVRDEITEAADTADTTEEEEIIVRFTPLHRQNLVRPSNSLTLLATGFTGWDEKTILMFSLGREAQESDTTQPVTERYWDFRGDLRGVFVHQLLARPANSAGSLVNTNTSGLVRQAPWMRLNLMQDGQGTLLTVYLARTASNELLIAVSGGDGGPGWPMRMIAF